VRRLPVLLAALSIVAAGCGDGGTATGDGTTPSGGAADGTRYQASTMVLESPDHGPQLCLGDVAASFPPQCGGPDVIGWDWAAVDDAESANGTTWGDYTVVGTWDGEALTLTEPPRAPEPEGAEPDDTQFDTPCPTPAGGWGVVDEPTATQEAMDRAAAYARSQPDVGGVWLDQSINPAAQREPIDEEAMNDPRRLVLNLSFTGDLARHEAAVRQVWGGALCVSEAPASAAELAAIRSEVEAEIGAFLWSSVDETTGRVEIGVAVDDGAQERLDERYGPGVVEVQARLQPVAG
jgi:hypothetical protein